MSTTAKIIIQFIHTKILILFPIKKPEKNLINIEFNLEELKLQKGKPKLLRSCLSPQKFLIHVVGAVSAPGRVKHAQAVFLGLQKLASI